MKLITLVQVSDSGDEEEGIIAKMLMVSPPTGAEISPFVCVLYGLIKVLDILRDISRAIIRCSWQPESSAGGGVEVRRPTYKSRIGLGVYRRWE